MIGEILQLVTRCAVTPASLWCSGVLHVSFRCQVLLGEWGGNQRYGRKKEEYLGPPLVLDTVGNHWWYGNGLAWVRIKGGVTGLSVCTTHSTSSGCRGGQLNLAYTITCDRRSMNKSALYPR